MILNFQDKLTEDIFNGVQNSKTRKIDFRLLSKIQRKLDMINAAAYLEDLKYPTGNRLEKLSGNLKEYYSIRVTNQWRIIFRWNNDSAINVRLIDYH